MRQTLLSGLAALAILGFAAGDARAAAIIIDDTNPDTVTITAWDFENGFSIDGVELTSGIRQSNSVTLADGLYGFSAAWVTFGKSNVNTALVVGTPGVAGSATAGIRFTGTNDGIAYVTGYFAADTGAFHSVLGMPGYPQGGGEVTIGLRALGITYIPEVVVPEPASLALFGSGLLGLGLARRRKA